MIKDKTLVIIAALNEEEGLGPTLTEINHFLEKPLCLVVDGQSEDSTVSVAKAFGAEVLFQKGVGKGDAIATAIQHLAFNPQYVAFIDGDYTYPAEYLSRMIQILQTIPTIGMVCGNRFNKEMHKEAMTNLFHLGNIILSFAHALINGIKMQDPLTGLRVVRGDIIKSWSPISKGFDIEVELNNLVKNKGFKIAEIPIFYRQRRGTKKLKLKHGFTIFKRILMQNFYRREKIAQLAQ